jgi:hypothetical protein
MLAYYRHMKFIPGNIYQVPSDNLYDIDVVNLDSDDVEARFHDLIPEDAGKIIGDFITASKPNRTIYPCIYCETLLYGGASYHIVYVNIGGVWTYRIVPYEKLWHIVPQILYNGRSVSSYTSYVSHLLQLSHTISADKYMYTDNDIKLEFSASEIILYCLSEEDWTMKPFLTYNKKEKTFVTEKLSKNVISTKQIDIVNMLIMTLFSREKYLYMTVEDDNVYEFIKL